VWLRFIDSFLLYIKNIFAYPSLRLIDVCQQTAIGNVHRQTINHGKPLGGMPFFRRVKTDSRQPVSRLAQYLRDLIGNNPVTVIEIYQ
jgi:hypothetical protein